MIKFDINDKISEKYLVRKFDVFKILDNYDMTGWIDKMSIDDSIIKIRDRVINNSNVLVVIGIGGSYLGSKAIYDMFSNYFDTKFEIIYAGNTMSKEYLEDLVKYLSDKDFSINVISKSGNTLETKSAYNYLIDYMKTKYDNYSDRVIMTTGNSGYLYDEAKKNNYDVLTIPEDIGGRYSMMTSAHLFPLSFIIDIDKFLLGYNSYNDLDLSYKYAAFRRTMFDNNKVVENFSVFEEKLAMFLEWIKQLFGESEGKGNFGIFPTSTIFTRDLHSLGQFIQDGNKILYETFIYYNSTDKKLVDAIRKAHEKGGVIVNQIELDDINEYDVGYLIKFFFYSAAISAILFDQNPFDQPGVEVYKSEIKERFDEK